MSPVLRLLPLRMLFRDLESVVPLAEVFQLGQWFRPSLDLLAQFVALVGLLPE